MFYFLVKLRYFLTVIALFAFASGPFIARAEAKDITVPQMHAGQVSFNDPGFTLNNFNVDRQWALAKSGFPLAWDVTQGTSDVVVAIIDTGIDSTHEDLAGTRFVSGYDFINKKDIPAGSNSDDNGHGTLVAGVVAAVGNNSIGIVGAAPKTSLMPLKALDDEGSGSSTNVSEAIVWAAEHGADVINLSLGGFGFKFDTSLTNAISLAYRKNVLIVAAAGNDAAVTGGNLDNEPVFPVCTDNGENMVLGVTASDVNDLKPGFANYGKSCIDVSAPGRRILSTINTDPATDAEAPNSYAYASGTSLAAPYVSALGALLRSKYPEAFNFQIRDHILATADATDILNLSQCNGSCVGLLGSGRINAARAFSEPLAQLKANNGDLVRLPDGKIYLINGGKRQFVGQFVQAQRFSGIVVKDLTFEDAKPFAEGSFAEPLDGTLVKTAQNPTVFYFERGARLPVLNSVFQARRFNYADVNSISDAEMAGWLLGGFLPHPEGTLLRTASNLTVYWVVGGALHPISNRFYVDKGLNVFPVVYVPNDDIRAFPSGDPYF